MTSPVDAKPVNDNGSSPSARSGPCPICHKPGVRAFEPFCSKRCSEVDLHRWLSGGYAIPAVEDDSEGAPGELADES